MRRGFFSGAGPGPPAGAGGVSGAGGGSVGATVGEGVVEGVTGWALAEVTGITAVLAEGAGAGDTVAVI